MICPACGEEMLILEFRGVEIDFCARCRGVWLDEGELAQLARNGSGSWDIPQGTARGRRRCPRCNRRMRLAVYPRTEVEVDVCPEGHGIWFDGGELEQVLRSGGALGAAELLREFLGGIVADTPAKSDEGRE